MIKDLVNQENLKLSNAVSTAKGFVATHKNVIGGLPPVSLKISGKCEQNGTPTPDNKVDIEGAGESGSLTVVSCAKNLFDLANAEWTKFSSAPNNTIVVEDNKLTMSGIWYNITPIKLEPNTDYYISADYTTDSTGVHAGKIAVKCGDETLDINKVGHGYTFNSGENSNGMVYFYLSGSSRGTTTWTNIQLEKGTVKTDYEPYTGTQADIPLSSPLYEKDYIKYRMDGTGEESHKMASVVFDGSDDEAWTRNALSDGSNPYYYIVVGDYGDVAQGAIKCTYLTQASISTSNTNNGINIINSSLGDARIIMRPSADVCTDEATFRAWLAEIKPEITYELAEPEVTALTEAQVTAINKLLSQDGLTNVMSEGMVESAYFANNADGKAMLDSWNIVKKTEENLNSFSKEREDIKRTSYGGEYGSVTKGGGTYNCLLNMSLDGEGVYLVTVGAVVTEWCYVGMLIVSDQGDYVLTPLVNSSNLTVSVNKNLDYNTWQLTVTNNDTQYDVAVKISIVKLSGELH